MDHNDNVGPIPNRWLRCPRMSSEVIVNKFIAFKTPLSKKFDSKVPLKYRFSPSMLFSSFKNKKVNIGLWIDLTNTSRFYNKEEIEAHNCKYIKLSCRGHGETPSEEQTNVFTRLCHNFISQNPLSTIAVHCTHGFNRTGFLIVSYLVENMDFSIEVALNLFAKARQPGIYKQDYIDELCRKYSDDKNDDLDIPPAPPLPDWCFEEENSCDRDENDDDAESSSSQNTQSTSKSKKSNRRINEPVFMAGVRGVEPFLDHSKAYNLQRKIQKMCGWKSKDGFPGSQPVSMCVENLKLLSEKPYRVSWKADGTRYMMLIDGVNEVYFFDRDNSVFHVKGIVFPHSKDLNRHLEETLLDGEMVIDKVNGEDIPRYLVYDIITFEGKNVGNLNFFPDRLQYVHDEIIVPRNKAIGKNLINKANEPFSIRNKHFWEITQAASLLGEKFSKTLSHEPDGLIFQPSKDPYIAGRCDSVLKWKPLDMNSIDFRLKIFMKKQLGCLPEKVCQLYVGQYDQPFANMKYSKKLQNLDNKIVECKLENGKWVFMRERTDKSFPNSFETAKAVYNSIRNPVTKEILLNHIARARYKDDTEIMPPPTKKIRTSFH